MIEKINKISNPLTIIAIFAALAEVAGTAALVAVDKEVQMVFVWFVMLFPTVLVVLFFFTLIFNHRVLYAPSDYNNEDNFLEAAKGKRQLDDNIEKLEAEVNALSNTLQEALPNNSGSINKTQIEDLRLAVSNEIASLKARFEVTRESADELIVHALPRSELQAKVFSFIHSSKKPVTLTELSVSLGVNETALNKAATKMAERGAIHLISYEGSQAYVR